MKIMAIDDDPTFLSIIQYMFNRFAQDHSIDLILYSDSSLALKEIEQHSPDIVLLDLFMPEVNGWEFMHKLSVSSINPSVFILSSSVDKNDRTRAKEFSLVKDFISKPLSVEQLQMVISLN